MSKIKTFLRLLFKDRKVLRIAIYNYKVKTGIYNNLSDVDFLKKTFKVRFGKELNLDNPLTFNEKLNWLKIYDRQPLYNKMVDKFEAKEIVKEKIGKEYIVPTIGIYNSVDDIDFTNLPNKFAIKCTHDSGSVVICKNKNELNVEKTKRFLKKCCKHNLFFWAREWPYKDVKPRIIVEEYIESLDENLVVYKVFCFHGKPYLIQVIQNDKHKDETIDYFDTNWNLLNLKQDFPNSSNHLKKPKALEEMLHLSSLFLIERPFIRVDWYIVNDKPIFSEFTFFSDAGFAFFSPSEWDLKLGEMMELPSVKEGEGI